MARSPFAVEAGDSLSAMGSNGTLRLWRAPFPVLSACVVDFGRCSERDLSLDPRCQYLYLDRAGCRRPIDVHIGAPVAEWQGRNFCRSTLCCKSLPSCDCLLAKRVRRIAGQLPAAPHASAGPESCRGRLESSCSAFSAAGGRVAY